ncbi:MAG: VOC family protein [Myxococcota bacterium]
MFNGRCREAFEYYARVLDGELAFMMTYGDSPMAGDVPDDCQEFVVHASVKFGAGELVGADALPSDPVSPQGFFVLLDPANEAEAARLFAALAEGGEVRMQLRKTFWSPAFGIVVDKFGIPWEISARDG